MAKAIKKYDNGLSIRYLVRPNKFYITFGVMHITVNGKHNSGFTSFGDAEEFLFKLQPMPYSNYDWDLKN